MAGPLASRSPSVTVRPSWARTLKSGARASTAGGACSVRSRHPGAPSPSAAAITSPEGATRRSLTMLRRTQTRPRKLRGDLQPAPPGRARAPDPAAEAVTGPRAGFGAVQRSEGQIFPESRANHAQLLCPVGEPLSDDAHAAPLVDELGVVDGGLRASPGRDPVPGDRASQGRGYRDRRAH